MDVATVAKFVGGGVVLLHAGVLLSVPYVLMGKGAPYLPTFAKPMKLMFNELLPRHIKRLPAVRSQVSSRNTSRDRAVVQSSESDAARLLSKVSIVDLGSGDGRLVFEAARRGYGSCEGYEINPVLYMFSEAWLWKHRLFGGFRAKALPQATGTEMPTTSAEQDVKQLSSPLPKVKFHLRDFWNVNLAHADVVIVYGLTPIMDRLSKKLWDELQPGALVVSNVFSLPTQVGWRQVGGEDGVFLYSKPVPGLDDLTSNDAGAETVSSSSTAGETRAPTPLSKAVESSTAVDEERERLEHEQKTGGWFFNIANAAAVKHELQNLDRHAKSKEAAAKRQRVLKVGPCYCGNGGFLCA